MERGSKGKIQKRRQVRRGSKEVRIAKQEEIKKVK
jgi:hypothetical protein